MYTNQPQKHSDWVHKNGDIYHIIGVGKMQCRDWYQIEAVEDDWLDISYVESTADKQDVVVYQSHKDDSIWVRPLAEFMDGRFTEV